MVERKDGMVRYHSLRDLVNLALEIYGGPNKLEALRSFTKDNGKYSDNRGIWFTLKRR